MAGPTGANREYDTPIGGVTEFRGNFQAGNVFSMDDIPIYDGTKFVPGLNTGLINGFGGLVTTQSAGRLADGSVIDDWDQTTPLLGAPLQMTPNIATGAIVVALAGVYEVSFALSISGLTNNRDYSFEMLLSGTPTGFGATVPGSNSIDSQSLGFELTAQAAAGAFVEVNCTSSPAANYDIISGTLSVKRIG